MLLCVFDCLLCIDYTGHHETHVARRSMTTWLCKLDWSRRFIAWRLRLKKVKWVYRICQLGIWSDFMNFSLWILVKLLVTVDWTDDDFWLTDRYFFFFFFNDHVNSNKPKSVKMENANHMSCTKTEQFYFSPPIHILNGHR